MSGRGVREDTVLPEVPLEDPPPHVWQGIERRARSGRRVRRPRRLASRALQVAAGLLGFLSVAALERGRGGAERQEADRASELLAETMRPLRHADGLGAATENLLLAHFDSHVEDTR